MAEKVGIHCPLVKESGEVKDEEVEKVISFFWNLYGPEVSPKVPHI